MKKLTKLITYSLLFLGLGMSIATAQPKVTEQAESMIRAGRYSAALRTLDNHLNNQPQDAEARFLRGLVLVKLGRVQDAIAVFSKLTKDFPQLPEPYNNLAVLYAQEGNYEKARDALEAALATHPSYATAHENLGDIYTALAGAAYNRALVLDQSNESLRVKLSLMEELNNLGVPAADQPQQVAQAPQFARPASQPKPVKPFTPPPPVITRPQTAQIPVAAVTPPRPLSSTSPVVTTPARTINTAQAPADAAIMGAVYQWAKVWSDQNVSGYINSYVPRFTPRSGLSNKAWKKQREQRLNKPKFIKIAVSDPRIKVESATRASVIFTQKYTSDTYKDSVRKKLTLSKVNNRWLISGEKVVR